MMLIGSRALQYWQPELKLKPETDWDIICTEEELKLFAGHPYIEWHDINHLNNKAIHDNFQTYKYLKIQGNLVPVCSGKGLKVLKRSHLWRDYQWDKHITHYNKYLSEYDLTEFQQEILKERTKLTKEAYPQGNPSLNQSNEDFFDDAVKKVYDHDFIHELAAYYGQPLYTRLKYDDSKAWCEKELWDQLSLTDKQLCVAEECYVIAVERFLLKDNFTTPARLAYLQALKKVCTTLTSGYFRDFALDHHPAIMALFDQEKINKIQKGLQDV